MGNELQANNGQGLATQVVGLIAEKNSDIDNGLLLNKINMIIAKTPKIGTMSPENISQAILKAMIPDATLQDHEDIYFVPYGNKIDVSFSHNYLQKLAYRNGAIKLIDTLVIYSKDKVEVTENGVSYSVNPFSQDRGDFVGIMVIVKLGNSEVKHGFVTSEHINKAKSASKSGNGGPWKTWFMEMAKKVAIKNTLKGLDISSEFNDALSIDNEDTDFKKLEAPKEHNSASKLEEMMISGNKAAYNITHFMSSLGIEGEEKEGWVMIDVINSDSNGIKELSSKMTLIEKPDRPGLLFGKTSELTGEVG